MFRTKKSVALFLTILMLCTMFTACAQTQVAEETSTGEATAQASADEDAESAALLPLDVAHMIHIPSLPTDYAMSEGLYESEYGLDINLMTFTSGPAINEALGSGEWDVAVYGGMPAILGSAANGSKIIGFTVNDISTQQFWVRPDSEIASITGQIDGYPNLLGDADSWRGKTILCPVATTLHFALLTLLDTIGLTSDDVEIINMEVPQAYTAFKSGQGDILCSWDPITFGCPDEGWIMVGSGPDVIDPPIPTVIMASESALAEKPEAVSEWLRSYYDYTEKFGGEENVEEVARQLVEWEEENGASISMENAIKLCALKPLIYYDETAPMFEGGESSDAVAVINTLINFMLEQGIADESQVASVQDIVYPDIILGLKE